MEGSGAITHLLQALERGETGARGELYEIVYARLRELAHARLSGEAPDHAFQTVDLVHEAYLRLVEGEERGYENRRHFFGAAAEAMRRILVDEARRRHAAKRGGGRPHVPLDAIDIGGPERQTQLLALDEALARLESQDPRKALVVKLRHYVAFGDAQIAEALGISERTVRNDWKFSRIWLQRELSKGDPEPADGS